MFQDLPQPVADRMLELEEIDTRDRSDGTARLERLRQIPRETGKFIALLAATAPAGSYLEIGTSAGYSTMWLALACRLMGRRITTFELLDEKATMARETFDIAELWDVVDFVQGDALEHLGGFADIGFCFLDAEKEIYLDCYETVVTNMIPGGILIADNAVNHEAALRPMLDRALNDERVDALIATVGKGELICRKL